MDKHARSAVIGHLLCRPPAGENSVRFYLINKIRLFCTQNLINKDLISAKALYKEAHMGAYRRSKKCSPRCKLCCHVVQIKKKKWEQVGANGRTGNCEFAFISTLSSG